MRYKKNERVIVHSLGDGKEYRAVVVGYVGKFPEMTTYIIKMVDRFREDSYEFDFVCITEYCLKEDLTSDRNNYGCYFMIDQNGGKPWSDCVVDSGEEECDYQVDNTIECAEDCKYWRMVK